MSLTAVLCEERTNVPGGVWTSKKWGEFAEGHARAVAVVEGKVELKTYKYAGSDSNYPITPIILMPRNNTRLFLMNMSITRRKQVVEDSFSFIPQLLVYLTKKTPKTRMIDIVRSGVQLKLKQFEDGAFNSAKGNIEISLNDVPEALSYLGMLRHQSTCVSLIIHHMDIL